MERASPPDESGPPKKPVWRILHTAENWLLTLVVAIMVLLPLAEIVLRRFGSGISGSSSFLQHAVLVAGMLGAAVAARENRLLSLSTFTAFLKGKWKAVAAVISGIVGVAVSAILCYASYDFVAVNREWSQEIAYGIPEWLLQLILPIGFGLITVRILLHHTGGDWKRRLFVLAGTASILAFAWFWRDEPNQLKIPLLMLLGIGAVFGVPIFTILGGAAAILFFAEESPLSSIALDHYQLTVNPILATIPLFTLAGYFLAEGGASKRLVEVFQSLVGNVRGGSAILTALVCAFFTSFTGASGVTILALGGLLMPVLLAARYSERNATGLLTATGSLGLLFPPSLPLILYAIVAGNVTVGGSVSITEMFLGGLLPGFLLVAMTAGLGIFQQPRRKTNDPPRTPFSLPRLGRAVWEAKWELLLPIVALTAMFSGYATPVEAAAVTALYGFIVEVFIFRDLHPIRDIPRVITECGLLVGGVLLILGVAMGFTNYLVDMQVPAQAVGWAQSTIHSTFVFLLVLNLFLLIVGCVMDIFSAIVIIVPLILPVAIAFGIHPVHLGIIFLANLKLGYMTPPVGMNLFLSSYRFGKSVPEVIRSVIPMFLVLLIGVLMITYLPWLTTWLPDFFGSE